MTGIDMGAESKNPYLPPAIQMIGFQPGILLLSADIQDWENSQEFGGDAL